MVLSSQRVDLKDALYYAVGNKDRKEVTNPLVQNGQKLIPSVTRVFRRDHDMYIYLQAYEQGASVTRPLIAFVSLYRGQDKAFETQPIEVAETLDSRLKTLPFQFSIALNNLSSGKYDCQVSVLDPSGQRAAFWQSRIMLVP